MAHKLLLMALAGAAGALARYGLSNAVHALAGKSFPWGTMAVNVLGCFLFGLVWALGEARELLAAETRTILLAGFMGAFTTFSTFVFESEQLLRGAQWLALACNLASQLGLGLGALVLGRALASAF